MLSVKINMQDRYTLYKRVTHNTSRITETGYMVCHTPTKPGKKLVCDNKIIL